MHQKSSTRDALFLYRSRVCSVASTYYLVTFPPEGSSPAWSVSPSPSPSPSALFRSLVTGTSDDGKRHSPPPPPPPSSQLHLRLCRHFSRTADATDFKDIERTNGVVGGRAQVGCPVRLRRSVGRSVGRPLVHVQAGRAGQRAPTKVLYILGLEVSRLPSVRPSVCVSSLE